jgi:hypothetical protein
MDMLPVLDLKNKESAGKIVQKAPGRRCILVVPVPRDSLASEFPLEEFSAFRVL